MVLPHLVVSFLYLGERSGKFASSTRVRDHIGRVGQPSHRAIYSTDLNRRYKDSKTVPNC